MYADKATEEVPRHFGPIFEALDKLYAMSSDTRERTNQVANRLNGSGRPPEPKDSLTNPTGRVEVVRPVIEELQLRIVRISQQLADASANLSNIEGAL